MKEFAIEVAVGVAVTVLANIISREVIKLLNEQEKNNARK